MDNQRPTWEDGFMSQAIITSFRSTCKKLAVGAVLTKDNQIIASGYNGSISGEPSCLDEGCYEDNGHCLRTIHAEHNAILQCARQNQSTKDTTIYVTHYPCAQCMKLLIQAGVKEVVYLFDYKSNHWMQSIGEKRLIIRKSTFNIELVTSLFLSVGYNLDLDLDDTINSTPYGDSYGIVNDMLKYIEDDKLHTSELNKE